MAYKKKSSSVFEHAAIRMASLKSIDSALDLGNGLTVEAYNQSIETVLNSLELYKQNIPKDLYLQLEGLKGKPDAKIINKHL